MERGRVAFLGFNRPAVLTGIAAFAVLATGKLQAATSSGMWVFLCAKPSGERKRQQTAAKTLARSDQLKHILRLLYFEPALNDPSS
jgi:hypothetical protein